MLAISVDRNACQACQPLSKLRGGLGKMKNFSLGVNGARLGSNLSDVFSRHAVNDK